MKADRWLLLSWKRLLLVAGAWVVSVLLHNFLSGAVGMLVYGSAGAFEEPVFFILAVFVIPIYLVVSLAYTIVRRVTA